MRRHRPGSRAWATLWPSNRLPPEKIAEIVAALRVNPNASQVARQVGGVTHVTVWRYAKAAGIKLEAGKAVQRRARKSAEKREQILAALKANPNARAVARQVGGISHSSVSKMARAKAIELRRYNRLPSAKVAEIVAALKDNSNARVVARQVGGVNHGSVCKIAKAKGIELAAGKAANKGARWRRMPSEKREQITSALKASGNATAVSRETGVGYKTVCTIAKAEGIEVTSVKVV